MWKQTNFQTSILLPIIMIVMVGGTVLAGCSGSSQNAEITPAFGWQPTPTVAYLNWDLRDSRSIAEVGWDIENPETDIANWHNTIVNLQLSPKELTVTDWGASNVYVTKTDADMVDTIRLKSRRTSLPEAEALVVQIAETYGLDSTIVQAWIKENARLDEGSKKDFERGTSIQQKASDNTPSSIFIDAQEKYAAANDAVDYEWIVTLSFFWPVE